MRQIYTALTTALVISGTIASSWFPGSEAAYNKWHQTELERWLSDHGIAHPTPADRNDLEALLERNWERYIVSPYKTWNTAELRSYLDGLKAGDHSEKSKESLVHMASSSWYETEESARHAWSDVKGWIFDTWSDSQLKAFADRHGIPVPQPRQRDSLVQKIRLNYEETARRLGETVSYPGSWLYDTWSESDLKDWLDVHGFPAPQPSSRDRLIASVRRNSRLAYLKARAQAASATASAQAAYETLTDIIIDAWDESQLKEFCDNNGISVPQGTRVGELRALVRKHRAEIMGGTPASKASSAFGAATSSAGNEYARASDSASRAYEAAFEKAIETWSESRLKAYLDARGVPVTQASKVDELRALVRKHSRKAATGWHAWAFDDFAYGNLREYLEKHGDAAARKVAAKKDATRSELVKAANSAYSSAYAEAGPALASATGYISAAATTAKQDLFDTWSETELKAYLDSYGVPVPQGSKIDQLKAEARKQATYFKYGTSSPSQSILARLEDAAIDSWEWVNNQLGLGSAAVRQKAAEVEQQAKLRAEEARNEL